VLVIDGADENSLNAEIAAVAVDLEDAEIVVNQDTEQAPAGAEPFDARTVALLNRGVPSFAVDSEGTLHTALMRSCTGWPSGTWIDEPRRTAPDVPTSTSALDTPLRLRAGLCRRRLAGCRDPNSQCAILAPAARSAPGTIAGPAAVGGSLLRVGPATR